MAIKLSRSFLKIALGVIAAAFLTLNVWYSFTTVEQSDRAAVVMGGVPPIAKQPTKE